LGVPSSSDGAGVSAQTLMLAKLAPELSMKNSPSAFEVQLTTPFRDPHFESSFASQISFLSNQGITHAKIHLNPQEMGPVSVDIHSVGNKIEVNFQAAREQTRQAIDASIDTLRGLMRDEGMTLQSAVVRSIEVAAPQAMSASSEQRSNDFQFDRSNQFGGLEKGFHQNSRGQQQPNDRAFIESDRTDTMAGEPPVGRKSAMIPSRLTGIDLFA
jgi:flagellar hook-length control protein FliK